MIPSRSPGVSKGPRPLSTRKKDTNLRSGISSVLAGSILLGATAQAQQAASVDELEVIVVTGSYIQGAAEDAALPVDVFTAEDLQMQGSPSMVDLVKSIPAVQGVLGESNQFGSAQSTGSSNINLRGIGAVRTLVLMNGRRIAASPTGNGVDTNLLPMAAIGRIEVLKDGAAATYGSDAVAGVVNFITKNNVEGLSLDASYSYIDGSDGDYSANALWGHRTDRWNFMVAGGYRHRSELNTTERDWAVRTFEENPQGGFSTFGNPGTYIATPTRVFRDPGCAPLGGTEIVSTTGTPQCRFQYIPFDNLTEREEHYQLYSEFNLDIGEKTGLHIEALYAVHDAPEENSSPSYAPTQGPALLNGNISPPSYTIPLSNPGLQAILPLIDPVVAAAARARGAVTASGLQWRPLGNGGNPLTGEGKKDERLFDGYRLSASLNGEFGPEIGWDVGLTFSENTRESNTPDMLAVRLQAALSGLGGPNCAPGSVAGSAGCLYLNPFSNAFAGNPAIGKANDYNFNPALANDTALIDWLFEELGFEDTASALVADVVFNGELPLSLPGGAIGWALGGQYRDEGFEREVNYFSNIELNPCVDTPVNGNTSCLTQSGVFTFFGPLRPQDLSRDVFGVFGEMNLPILESLQAQLALRYEDYGGSIGSTTNPKISLRWQALDWLALRGSAGSTFRGPQQTQVLDGFTTSLQFTSRLSGYKPYDTYGNPDLEPEEADTFNVGALVQAGGFKGSLDYWKFKFKNPITTEGGPDLAATFFGTSTAPLNFCGAPGYEGLQARFEFAGAACAPEALIRTKVNVINGPEENISGLDASLAYLFDGVFGGELMIGADASYTLEYERDALIVEGVQIQPQGDYSGTRGGGGGIGSLPNLRGSVYADFSTGTHSVRATSRYIAGVTDVRTSVQTGHRDIGSFLTHDLVYRLQLQGDTTVSAAVFNLTDRDPPLVWLDLSYDPFIGNPLGRYFKVALTKEFE